MSDNSNLINHWRKTIILMTNILFVWVIFSFVIHFFVNSLNDISFIGFPLGFYMAAQGSLIVFVIIIFLYAKMQSNIDKKYGVEEE